MTDTDTPAKLQAPSDLDGYSAFVSRLLANRIHPTVVPLSLLREIMGTALASKQILDEAKKGLFYGKDSQNLEKYRNYLAGHSGLDYNPDLLPILHCILGLRTEADELLELLLELSVSDCPSFRDNEFVISTVTDEAGDVLFYLQGLMTAIGRSIPDAMQRNAAKLITRFPEGYKEERAINPDKAAEAAAQEALRP